MNLNTFDVAQRMIRNTNDFLENSNDSRKKRKRERAQINMMLVDPTHNIHWQLF